MFSCYSCMLYGVARDRLCKANPCPYTHACMGLATPHLEGLDGVSAWHILGWALCHHRHLRP
jgi:hypothetical protein